MGAAIGSCKCKSVCYEIATDIRQIVNCHCTICRKMNGSAFSTYAIVPKQFVTLTGQENIIEFQVEEGTSKHCCKKCGSPLFNLNSQYPKYAMVYLGSLDNNTIEPTHNIYCANMLAWVEHIAPIQKWDQAITKKTL